MDLGQSWYPSGISTATPAEYRVAALALVYHATSTGAEDSLKKLINMIVKSSASYSPEGDWKPPVEWSTTERGIIDLTRDWLEKAMPKGHGTINPVLQVAENTYQIFTTTDSIYRWRRMLCGRIQSKTPAPQLSYTSIYLSTC